MPDRSVQYSWFRQARGRRYGREFAAIVVCKLVALTLLWFFCIRPVPRADTAPAAIEHHVFSLPAVPAASEASHDR